MLKKITYYSLLLTLSGVVWLFSLNFRSNNKRVANVRYDFAFNIGATYNSQLVTFSIVATRDGKIIYKKNISESSFIRQVAGLELSKANPDKVNYFEKYELTDCFYKYDSIRDLYVDGYNCFRLTDLWALRYGRNPMCGGDCTPTKDMLVNGWAGNNFRPTWPQIQILQEYGIINIDDTFYGENMFRLFRDMKDSNWISRYVNAGKSGGQSLKG